MQKINLLVSSKTELWVKQATHAHFLSEGVILCSNQEVIESYSKVTVDKKKSNLADSIESIEERLNFYLPILAKRLQSLYGHQEMFWEQVLFFYIRDLLGATQYFFYRLEENFNPERHILKILKLYESPPLYGIYDSLVDAHYSHSTNMGREYFVGEYFRLFYPERFEEVSLLQSTASVATLKKKSNFRSSIKKIVKHIQDISGNGIKIFITNAKYDALFAKKMMRCSLGKIYFTEAVPSLENKINKKLERNHELRHLISAQFSASIWQDKFEKYFCYCLHNSFPWSLAEGFNESFKFYAEYWKSFPKLSYLISENQYQHHSLAVAVFSLMRGKLITLPHFYPWEVLMSHRLNYLQKGVMLCVNRSSARGDLDNSIGTGALYSYSIPASSKEKLYDILYVATEFTPNLLAYQISVDGDGYEVYEKFKIFVDELFQALPKSLIQKMSLKQRVKPRHDGVLLEYPICMDCLDSEYSAPIYMANSKIIIVEGFSTALFEALISNIPVLSFWPKELYYLDENFADFFEELEFAGLIHHCPLQLSQMLIKIQENPSIWWQSEEVQLARTSFLEKNFHLLPEMKNTLLSLLKE